MLLDVPVLVLTCTLTPQNPYPISPPVSEVGGLQKTWDASPWLEIGDKMMCFLFVFFGMRKFPTYPKWYLKWNTLKRHVSLRGFSGDRGTEAALFFFDLTCTMGIRGSLIYFIYTSTYSYIHLSTFYNIIYTVSALSS